jgi:steroid delta-isomerase-like uncharacterized protein
VPIEQTKAIAQRWMDEIWQKAGPSAMDEILASDFTFNYAAPGVKPDREGYKQTLRDIYAGFPDIKFTTEDIVVEGDKAAVYWKGRGTHKGQYWGIAPTGKQVTMAGISIINAAGGKIVEEIGYTNMMELMQELGALPPSG